MYTFNSRVRYSETDENGLLSPLSIINYLQDCSTFQSEDLGVGVEWLKERHRAWLLNSWRILFDRYPKLGEELTIGTFPYGFKGLYGMRHFFIKDAAGAFCVRADSIWILCDTDTGLPVKPEGEHAEPYLGQQRIELHMGETKRKIALPKDMRGLGQLTVLRHHLDTNHHVNNAQYVDMALSAAGVQYPKELQAEYKKQAVLGDEIYLKYGVTETENGAFASGGTRAAAGSAEAAGGTSKVQQFVALCQSDGKPYASVRFSV